jgi:oxygen-independent coproporphyrinogen-3 oxidase
MKSKQAAFDNAHTVLHYLGIPDILPRLHDAGVGISRSVLGGSHSVAVYPPIDSLKPLDARSIENDVTFGGDVSLYVHIAFCETRCTFCHYAVHHYGGKASSTPAREAQVTQYVEALKRELRMWGAKLARRSTTVSSIYIGGGTPLILEQAQLRDIIETLQDEFEIEPGAEFCIEGSPLTLTVEGGADKLRFLKEHGITRLSFGVQSFDDDVLKFAARGYRRDTAIRAASLAGEVFDNWNLDLIQGLYKGSPDETWENLQVIAEIRPPHLTWYHGRFAERPQGDWYNMPSRHAGFEDENATLLGRMLIWQQMRALGYDQSDGNRFVRAQRYVDPFKKIRTSASSNLLGVGAASYSHIDRSHTIGGRHGYIFRNDPDIGAYVERVSSGHLPVASGRIIDDAELLATSYATGLRHGRFEDEALRLLGRREPELAAHYGQLVRNLQDVGVLELRVPEDGTERLHLSELGKLYEDEALALFYSPAVKRALAMTISGVKPTMTA